MQNTLLGVETNIANWQRKQNAANNWSATIPYDMELQRKETKEMLDDLTTRDQRMMFGLVTLVHMADNPAANSTVTPRPCNRWVANTCASSQRCAGSKRTASTPCCPTVCAASKPCAR